MDANLSSDKRKDTAALENNFQHRHQPSSRSRNKMGCEYVAAVQMHLLISTANGVLEAHPGHNLPRQPCRNPAIPLVIKATHSLFYTAKRISVN